MIKRTTLYSHIIFFLIKFWAVGAQSSSPHTKDVSSDHMLVALFCIILGVTIFSILLRHCSNNNTEDFNTTGGAATITNCPSSIAQGIDPKFLNTFPTVIYSTQKFHVVPNECSVCLNEFNQNDVLRLLPICNHFFHPQCIDAWLASHVTCPVCRTCLSQADGGDHEVVIVIPDEVNSEGMFDESCESRREVNSGYVIRTLGRCHSTGHSMGFGEIGGKGMEGYNNIRNLEDVKKNINKISHGGMRRSASSNMLVDGDHGEKKSIESISFLNRASTKI